MNESMVFYQAIMANQPNKIEMQSLLFSLSWKKYCFTLLCFYCTFKLGTILGTASARERMGTSGHPNLRLSSLDPQQLWLALGLVLTVAGHASLFPAPPAAPFLLLLACLHPLSLACGRILVRVVLFPRRGVWNVGLCGGFIQQLNSDHKLLAAIARALSVDSQSESHEWRMNIQMDVTNKNFHRQWTLDSDSLRWLIMGTLVVDSYAYVASSCPQSKAVWKCRVLHKLSQSRHSNISKHWRTNCFFVLMSNVPCLPYLP